MRCALRASHNVSVYGGVMRHFLQAAVVAAIIGFGSAADAQQLMRFLVAQWVEGGNNFCKYDDGTVLNMGYKLCPLSI